MNYTVVWQRRAELQLAALWLRAANKDADQFAGARTALANCRKADLPPSGLKHDEALKG